MLLGQNSRWIHKSVDMYWMWRVSFSFWWRDLSVDFYKINLKNIVIEFRTCSEHESYRPSLVSKRHPKPRERQCQSCGQVKKIEGHNLCKWVCFSMRFSPISSSNFKSLYYCLETAMFEQNVKWPSWRINKSRTTKTCLDTQPALIWIICLRWSQKQLNICQDLLNKLIIIVLCYYE